MSASPVVSLRILQSLIRLTTGTEVPLLDLSKALLEAMAADSLRFNRSTVKTYYRRLRNWQIADQIVIRKLQTIRREQQVPILDLENLYAVYCGVVKEARLVPMSMATFRWRTYSLPKPKLQSR